MSLLLATLRQPSLVRDLTPSAWNELMQEVRTQRVDARLSYLLEDQGLATACPAGVWTELQAQRYQPAYLQAQARLELRKLHKTLAPAGIAVILLKGAGYQRAGLPFARGRLFSDIDLLVRREHLAQAEALLLAAGWVSLTVDAYDQRYYRRWMHELPPLRHPEREVIIDLHHAILPLTSRLRPDPALLWAAAVPIASPTDPAPFAVLCPTDMVLHSATHLFHDGAIADGFNNLLDLHDLLTQFGPTPGFFADLRARAAELDLGRPLFYALLFCRELLGTPVPAAALQDCRAFAPNALVGALMRRLVVAVLTPRWPRRRPAHLAAWLLYLRSHWLRMPPTLLAAHLGRKLLRRAGDGLPGDAKPG